MKECRVFVVVPALDMTGPIKGAVALCNGLVHYVPVTLVFLKSSTTPHPEVSPQVEVQSLAHCRNGIDKLRAYRRILLSAGGSCKRISISFCFSADLLNSCSGQQAITMSSVRGNLLRNYRYDYGLRGILYAFLHMMLLHRFEHVIVMSQQMKEQLQRFGLKRCTIIGNFLDESMLEAYRLTPKNDAGPVRFVFVASLSPRKRPELLINVMAQLCERGADCYADFVGDGPMRRCLEQQVAELNLGPRIVFHGHLANPYGVLQRADWLVHPSESEGLSRSVLEALFFGVRCILRDVDANASLVPTADSGLLFSSDDELVHVMSKALLSSSSRRANWTVSCLLPPAYRQDLNIRLFRNLMS